MEARNMLAEVPALKDAPVSQFLLPLPQLSQPAVPTTMLAAEDQPDTRVARLRRAELSDAELLAVLIGRDAQGLKAKDLATFVLAHGGNSLDRLGKMSLAQLEGSAALTKKQALHLYVALEIGRRRAAEVMAYTGKKPVAVHDARECYALMAPLLLGLDHEQFHVILLNQGNRVLRVVRISEGGIAGTVADARVIFKAALDHNASSLILVHNHPSGNVQPSNADINLTRKLRDGAALLDLRVLDHMVFSDSGWYSFADEGTL